MCVIFQDVLFEMACGMHKVAAGLFFWGSLITTGWAFVWASCRAMNVRHVKVPPPELFSENIRRDRCRCLATLHGDGKFSHCTCIRPEMECTIEVQCGQQVSFLVEFLTAGKHRDAMVSRDCVALFGVRLCSSLVAAKMHSKGLFLSTIVLLVVMWTMCRYMVPCCLICKKG